MPYAIRKVDKNQPEIVRAFRSLGFSVLLLHTVGHGCPDLCVAKAGRTQLVEVKDGERKWKLTKDESDFVQEWNDKVEIVDCVDDVIALAKRWSIT